MAAVNPCVDGEAPARSKSGSGCEGASADRRIVDKEVDTGRSMAAKMIGQRAVSIASDSDTSLYTPMSCLNSPRSGSSSCSWLRVSLLLLTQTEFRLSPKVAAMN